MFGMSGPEQAIRAAVSGEAADARVQQATVAKARELGALGWVRAGADGGLLAHAEGAPDAVAALVAWLGERVAPARVDLEEVAVEGHEQFARRGVSAGEFVVQEHAATAHHFDLRLEVGGMMRSWAVPRGPSLDPAVKRLAVQVEDHAMSHNSYEGARDGRGVIVWDRGTYEQGGRVAWPEALDRGHAVFVLHGEKLRGGFALQRTRRGAPSGEKAQWLLIKRRDDEARAGFDIEAERPESVLSGRTLAELLGTDPDRP